MSNVYTELRDARKRIAELETALREIYECMGGDDVASGWQDPNRVWGVARAALEAASKGEG
jgi:hypothetical protein